MNQPKAAPEIRKEDAIRFFNLTASLPKWMVQSEYDRQTQKKYNVLVDEEIHNDDQRKIHKLMEDNPVLTLEEAANIYYDTKEYGPGPTALQYIRGQPLVEDGELKNLTTYMRQLHQYYMAQVTETEAFGFEVIIRAPLVFYYSEEEKRGVGWECLFNFYQRRSLDAQIMMLWTM